jgi:hypothetical protein
MPAFNLERCWLATIPLVSELWRRRRSHFASEVAGPAASDRLKAKPTSNSASCPRHDGESSSHEVTVVREAIEPVGDLEPIEMPVPARCPVLRRARDFFLTGLRRQIVFYGHEKKARPTRAPFISRSSVGIQAARFKPAAVTLYRPRAVPAMNLPARKDCSMGSNWLLGKPALRKSARI